MISFDLGKEEFVDLVKDVGLAKDVVVKDVVMDEAASATALVQLMATVRSDCSPLQLYASLQHTGYSYLLESVEKEKRHARFSFVGADPDVVVTIKDRTLILNYSKDSGANPGLMDHIHSQLKSVCTVELFKNGVLHAQINEGIDVLDAFRAVFPTANGTVLLNQKRFDRQTFLGGAIGYNGYDIVYDCWLDIKKRFRSDTPDMQFALTTKTFVFDHLTNDIHIVVTPFVTAGCDPASVYEEAVSQAQLLYGNLVKAAEAADADRAEDRADSDDIKDNNENSAIVAGPGVTLPRVTEVTVPAPLSGPVCNMEQEAFENAVVTAKQHIIDGDIFQVVLSRRYSIKIKQEPLELYRTLRRINPSPYMYLFKFGDLGIVGASPETLMTVHERKVITNPIAGTCPRGRTEEEDAEAASAMLGDEKECAEHVMLVDLGRNDVRMVSKSGTVKVDDFMTVVKYSHVQHIESTVSGILRDECDQFDATRAIFPAGTLSGAPKIRAMEIIDELETTARGVYGGGVGYYSWNGDADFAIVIRTVILKGDIAYVQAGAGIVADSDPAYEYEETERKMAAMLSAIGSETGSESEIGNKTEDDIGGKSGGKQ